MTVETSGFSKAEADQPKGQAIAQAELARMLGLSERHVLELARGARLPFSVTIATGLHIHRHDLPAWRSAARTGSRPRRKRKR